METNLGYVMRFFLISKLKLNSGKGSIPHSQHFRCVPAHQTFLLLIGPSALCVVCKCSTAKLHAQPGQQSPTVCKEVFWVPHHPKCKTLWLALFEENMTYHIIRHLGTSRELDVALILTNIKRV